MRKNRKIRKNEKFNKEIEIMKKEPNRTLDLKNSVNENFKNAVESIYSRIDQWKRE